MKMNLLNRVQWFTLFLGLVIILSLWLPWWQDRDGTVYNGWEVSSNAHLDLSDLSVLFSRIYFSHVYYDLLIVASIIMIVGVIVKLKFNIGLRLIVLGSVVNLILAFFGVILHFGYAMWSGVPNLGVIGPTICLLSSLATLYSELFTYH